MKKLLTFAITLSACSLLYPKSSNKNKEISKNTKSIEITLYSENIEIFQSSNNDFSIDIDCNHPHYQPIVKHNNNKLQITAQKKIKPLFYRCKIKLYIPKNQTLDYINLKSSSGRIEIDKLKSDDVNINSTSGTIKIESLSTTNTSIKATSGTIKIDKNNAKHTNIETTSGTIDIEENKSEDIYLHSTSGTVRIRNNESNFFAIKSTSGTINVGKNDSDSFEIKSTSGTIKLQLEQAPSDLSRISSTSGSVYLSIPNKKGFDINYYTNSGVFKDRINSNTISTIKNKEYFISYFGGGTKIDVKTTSGCFELSN